MKIKQAFRVERPAAEVWTTLADIPAVARCLPGAEVTADKGGGAYAGKLSVKLGPFSAAFEGEASVARNEAERTGRVEGKGVDRRGGSRSRMTMDYRVLPDGAGSRIEIDADIVLAGPIAQFGRIGLMQETASILIKDFAVCLEGRLRAKGASRATAVDNPIAGPIATAPPAVPDTSPRPPGISVLSLLWRMIVAWVNRVLGR